MKAHQILQSVSPELGREVLLFFRDSDAEERNVFKTTVATLAGQRKLRPVFIQRKSKDEQLNWVLETLKLRTSDQVAEHLMQIWLMKSHSAMLVDFLDAAGVEHDGEGGVDDLPESFDPEKLVAAIDKLLENNPGERVAVYLHLFQLQQPGGWNEIENAIAARPALQLGAGTA